MKVKYLNTLFLLGLIFSMSAINMQVIADGATSLFDYDKEWSTVYQLEKNGKPQSAIVIVNKIYEQAKTDKNEPQMIKSMEYGIRLSARFMEDYYEKGIASIQKELPSFSEPSVQILHSLLADLYIGYYSSHRYLVLQRTNVQDYELSDMASWDQKLFAEKIFNELNLSLNNASLLKITAASAYADIITKADSLDVFRPSLFDLLAHQALDFFRNDEFMSSRPAVRFEIDDPQMLDLSDAFVKLEPEEKEAFSMKFHALQLYQELIAFHLNDKNPTALIDVDLKRLDFVYQHAIFDEKDKLLLHTLEQMESKYMGHEAVTEVYYQLALYYERSGNKYDPLLLSEDHKRDKIIAVQYCQNAIKEFPASYGTAYCKNLLKDILEKSLNCQLDYAGIPGKSILSSLAFKNVSEIYLRIVPLDPAEDRKQRLTWNSDAKLKHYKQLRPVKQRSTALPADDDHNGHRTEIAIPPLTEGYYGLMISDNPAFDKSKGVISINNFWVTNLSYINTVKDNGDLMFYVLDRESGNTIPGVKILVYEEYYETRSREYHLKETGTYVSDKDGSFVIRAARGNSNRLVLDFITEVDRFTSPNFFYISKPYDHPDKAVKQTFFSTPSSPYTGAQNTYISKGFCWRERGKSTG